MHAIVKASKEAGLTLDQIREKRHAFDHDSGGPRPDQLPIMKNLGMMVSMNNTRLWENRTYFNTSWRVRDYGIEIATWAVPRKSATAEGVMSGFELDRPLPHMVFFFVHVGMTRFNDGEQRVYGPGQRTDRIIQLKALTRWGASYVLREKVLGSLEAGKFADFIVLDRDFLTIPEEDIPNVHVLMTMLGGNIVHLMPNLAQESGLSAVGPATWPTKPLENYYAQ